MPLPQGERGRAPQSNGGKPAIDIDTVIRFQDGTTQRIRTTLNVVDLGAGLATAEAAE